MLGKDDYHPRDGSSLGVLVMVIILWVATELLTILEMVTILRFSKVKNLIFKFFKFLRRLFFQLIFIFKFQKSLTSSHLSTNGTSVLFCNTSVSLSKSMMSTCGVSSGMVDRTKVTVEMITTDMEVKANI